MSSFDWTNLANDGYYQELNYPEKVKYIEEIVTKLPEERRSGAINSAGQYLKSYNKSIGIDRGFDEGRVLNTMRSVLPEGFDELDKEAKVEAIDSAREKLKDKSKEVDPINWEDTQYYADLNMSAMTREILGEDVGYLGDKSKRFAHGIVQSVFAPFNETGTQEFLSKALPTNPKYDEDKSSMVIQAGGDFVGQIAQYFGIAALTATTGVGGVTAGSAKVASLASRGAKIAGGIGLGQNVSRKFQQNYNKAIGELNLGEDEALAAGIAGTPGALIDSLGDMFLLRGIKLGSGAKSFKSMSAADKAKEIVAKGKTVLKDPKVMGEFTRRAARGAVLEGTSEMLGDAATSWGGYATSGHEGFVPKAGELWDSFWVGGLLGGAAGGALGTKSGLRNQRALKEIGEITEDRFLELAEETQIGVAESMDKGDYVDALNLIKGLKRIKLKTEGVDSTRLAEEDQTIAEAAKGLSSENIKVKNVVRGLISKEQGAGLGLNQLGSLLSNAPTTQKTTNTPILETGIKPEAGQQKISGNTQGKPKSAEASTGTGTPVIPVTEIPNTGIAAQSSQPSEAPPAANSPEANIPQETAVLGLSAPPMPARLTEANTIFRAGNGKAQYGDDVNKRFADLIEVGDVLVRTDAEVQNFGNTKRVLVTGKRGNIIQFKSRIDGPTFEVGLFGFGGTGFEAVEAGPQDGARSEDSFTEKSEVKKKLRKKLNNKSSKITPLEPVAPVSAETTAQAEPTQKQNEQDEGQNDGIKNASQESNQESGKQKTTNQEKANDAPILSAGTSSAIESVNESDSTAAPVVGNVDMQEEQELEPQEEQELEPVISQEEMPVVIEDIEEIQAEIVQESPAIQAAVTEAVEVEGVIAESKKIKTLKERKEHAKKLLKNGIITQSEHDQYIGKKPVAKAKAEKSIKEKVARKEDEQVYALANLRGMLMERVEKIKLLLNYKAELLGKERFPQSLQNLAANKVAKFEAAIQSAEKATDLERIWMDIDSAAEKGSIISSADVTSMIAAARTEVMKGRGDKAKQQLSDVAEALTPNERGLLFQQNIRGINTGSPEFQSLPPEIQQQLVGMTQDEVDSMARIVSYMQTLGIESIASEADQQAAMEIRSSVDAGVMTKGASDSINKIAPSRAVFANKVQNLFGIAQGEKNLFLLHIDVMAVNSLKAGGSLQAFYAKLPDIEVVDAIYEEVTIKGKKEFRKAIGVDGVLVLDEEASGKRAIEDASELMSQTQAVTDREVNTNKSKLNVPFSPIAGKIMLVKGRYTLSTLIHENDHNMIVTGQAQSIIENQEGGTELWSEVLNAVGATRGELWSVAAHEKWTNAREAWIRDGDSVSDLFKRAFQALKDIFKRLYADNVLSKHRDPVLEKAFQVVYGIDSLPVAELKVKVQREIGKEASQLLGNVDAKKLIPAQSVVTVATKEATPEAAEVVVKEMMNGTTPFTDNEQDAIKAVVAKNYNPELPLPAQEKDINENFFKAENSETPNVSDQGVESLSQSSTDSQKAQVDKASRIARARSFIKAIVDFFKEAQNIGAQEGSAYAENGEERVIQLAKEYFDQPIKMGESDLIYVIKDPEDETVQYNWMPESIKEYSRFLMNIVYIGYNQVESVLTKNPNAKIYDFMLDRRINGVKGVIRGGSNEGFYGKVEEAINTGLQRNAKALNPSDSSASKIEDVLFGMNLKTVKKNGQEVYTKKSKQEIAARLDSLYPDGWVVKSSAGYAGSGIYTKTGTENDITQKFEDSEITKSEYIVEQYDEGVANSISEFRVHGYVKNGVLGIVPYATGRRNTYNPYMIRTKIVKEIEQAALDFSKSMTNLKEGDLFGFDVVQRPDGTLTVVESNYSEQGNEFSYGAGSAFLDRPFYNMAVASHIQGRTPAYALIARIAARNGLSDELPSKKIVDEIERIYQNFKDYASFAREMVKNFGDYIIDYVRGIWGALTVNNGRLTNKSAGVIAAVEKSLSDSLSANLFQTSDPDFVDAEGAASYAEALRVIIQKMHLPFTQAMGKLEKAKKVLIDSLNTSTGKDQSSDPKKVRQAAATVNKVLEEVFANATQETIDAVNIEADRLRNMRRDSWGIFDDDTLVAENNIRDTKNKTPEQDARVRMQKQVATLKKMFANMKATNRTKNAFHQQIKPEFSVVAGKLGNLMSRGVNNVLAAFNMNNAALLDVFIENLNIYKGGEGNIDPEFIDDFDALLDQVEEEMYRNMAMQLHAYNQDYIQMEGITDELDALIESFTTATNESPIDFYNRIVQVARDIEATIQGITEEDLSDADAAKKAAAEEKKKEIRAKRERIAATRKASLKSKFPTFEDLLDYKVEKDGGALTPMFMLLLKLNYDWILSAPVETMSDAKLHQFNSSSLTLLVGGSNTGFLIPYLDYRREQMLAHWREVVSGLGDRIKGSSPVRSIYMAAGRNGTFKKWFNSFDTAVQAKVENFHVWADRFSKYPAVRNWFDKQFFADFQAGAFVEAENAGKQARAQFHDIIKAYNEGIDTTVKANPYLWVMSVLSQYQVGQDPNVAFRQNYDKAVTSLKRAKTRDATTSTAAEKNEAALNYMLEGINLDAETAYSDFMAASRLRIGAGDKTLANERMGLLATISDLFELDIANQIFIRENFHGEPFKTQMNYIPFRTQNTDGSPQEMDIMNVELESVTRPSGANVNKKSQEDRTATLGATRMIGMDMFQAVERKLIKNAIDKHSILSVAVFKKLFQYENVVVDGATERRPVDPLIKEVFGNNEEAVGQINIINAKIHEQMVQIYGVTEPPNEFISGTKKAIGLVQSSMLSGLGQVLQQSVSAIVDYSGREKGNISYMIDAIFYWTKNYDKVRAWMEVNARDIYERSNTQGILENEKLLNRAGTELGSIIDKIGGKVDVIRKAMTISLRYGDKVGTELIFLAEHMKALELAKLKPKFAPYDIDNFTNPEITAAAQAGVARFVGTSGAAGRSWWMSDHKQAYFLLRAITGSFQSSAHNMSSQMLGAARNAVGLWNDKTPEGVAERRAELRKIGFIMGQQATFTTMRFLFAGMVTTALAGALREAFDDDDDDVKKETLELERVRAKDYRNTEEKKRAVAVAERELADAKALRKAIIGLNQQKSGDAWFKSMVRDQLTNLHIAGSVGDGFFPTKVLTMVPNMLQAQSHKQAQDVLVDKLKKQKSDALAEGDRAKAAKIAQQISDAQANEYLPYFYEKKDKSGFGGIIGGVLDPIYTSMKEGAEDMSRADRDFLTTRAFIPDMITYMASIGLGQADVNRVAKAFQRIDDELSSNRLKAEEKAGKEVNKKIDEASRIKIYTR